MICDTLWTHPEYLGLVTEGTACRLSLLSGFLGSFHSGGCNHYKISTFSIKLRNGVRTMGQMIALVPSPWPTTNSPQTLILRAMETPLWSLRLILRRRVVYLIQLALPQRNGMKKLGGHCCLKGKWYMTELLPLRTEEMPTPMEGLCWREVLQFLRHFYLSPYFSAQPELKIIIGTRVPIHLSLGWSNVLHGKRNARWPQVACWRCSIAWHTLGTTLILIVWHY